MHIEWNRVTKFSQAVALVVFIGTFFLGFWLGQQSEAMQHIGQTAPAAVTPETEPTIADVTYTCDGGKTARAIYRDDSVELFLSDGRHFSLLHALSADGARYANKDESIVFWSRGDGAFMTEGSSTTFKNCTKTGSKG